MDIKIPSNPFIIPEFKIPTGGVDFLGLRQANLEMMRACLPGINNVTKYIRPYSLLSWIYWKFYQIGKLKDVKDATVKDIEKFRDKVELLFTWGHALQGIKGIPGLDSKPPSSTQGKFELSFNAWKRIPDSTSLMAAIQYGPSTKTVDGLSFLEPVAAKVFKAFGNGIKLAEALDELLTPMNCSLLNDIDHNFGSPKEAHLLFDCWRIDQPSDREKQVFREAFYQADYNQATSIGRRSSTIGAILQYLKHTHESLSEDQLRKGLSYMRLPNNEPFLVEVPIQRACINWLILQTRQAFRLSLESMLSFIEYCIIDLGLRDMPGIVNQALHHLSSEDWQINTSSP